MNRQRAIRYCLLAVIGLGGWGAPLAADVKLPAIFADHMVLQRERAVPVWGWAEVGEEVHVLLGDEVSKTAAGPDGKWRVEIAAHDAGGPHRMVVEGANNRLQVDDIYFGEVWVCSGQSNMGWTVKASTNADAEIAAANYPKIRLFKVPLVPASKPQEDCGGKWHICSPQTVANFSAVAFFYGRELHKELDIPIGLLQSAWGGTLAEAWTSREALEAKEELQPIIARMEQQKEHRHRASHLYNGMLTPIIPYGIRGAIWYQGESNVTRAEQYATLFPAMIDDWRAQWGQGDFPFYFVQLAPFHYNGHPQPDFLAEQWDSQLHTLRTVSKTGMAVTTDITTINDIHPPNKQDVGKRLALWALANDYGCKECVFSGPLYQSVEFADGKAILRFEHVGGGLMTRDGEPPSEFTIAGTDKKFVPAETKIEGDTVIVWSGDVVEPTSVRMGWRNIAEPNLANKEGLPASPFRTDRWPLKTAGQR